MSSCSAAAFPTWSASTSWCRAYCRATFIRRASILPLSKRATAMRAACVARRLVKAPLAARLPLEVLYGVRYVDVVALHSGGLERAVEKPSGGADERQAFLVLLVARLLADQHDASVGRAGAEHRLGGVRPQRAVLALACILAQLLKALHHGRLESAK